MFGRSPQAIAASVARSCRASSLLRISGPCASNGCTSAFVPLPAPTSRLSSRLRTRPTSVLSASHFGQRKTFKGRIAWSADGNHNDPDDWAASPVALAIFAEAGVKDRLVHFDYNCILPATDPKWESIHATSVLGAAERYGYNKAVFHDCRKDLDGAVASIARAINDSTADNPLYFIVAGPMEVPLLGIKKSDPARRKFVYCISHSCWNDGFSAKYKFTNTK